MTNLYRKRRLKIAKIKRQRRLKEKIVKYTQMFLTCLFIAVLVIYIIKF